MIFGNTDLSDNAVWPWADDAKMIVGCCLVTVNVRVITVVVAVEVIFIGSLSNGSDFGVVRLATDFTVRSRAVLLMRKSESKSENKSDEIST